MDKVQLLREQLRPWQAERLDGSARGSGLNAVWKIRTPAGPAILKTFASRRNPAQTFLTEVNHRLGGLTSFTARGRRHTEAATLALWREAGLDVPRLLDDPPGLDLALPHLCMEFVDGVLLSRRLADEGRPLAERDAVLVRFLRIWADRHALADARRDPRLIQEHGSFEHVMVAGDRLVTFDLEVSFRRRLDVRACIVAEIGGYLRSLYRLLPAPLAGHFLGLAAREYPRREYLEEVPRRLLRNPNPVLRAVHFLDRRLLRKPGQWHKFRVAELLMSELNMR
ncbi:MAG: hypothetical protein KBA95_01310 [Acidobacteria bacterium]|nr:hypothetical protein [Acidobacteriota bacterium]